MSRGDAQDGHGKEPERRLTRSERRARIREELLDAAEVLFAREGIQATSVEKIAAEAGFTRGAVYSNFADKDDLVVALLDRRVERSIFEIDEIYEQSSEPQAFYEALHERQRERTDTDEERVLFVEFWLHALRTPSIRPKLAQRFAAKRAAVADFIVRQYSDLGIELRVDPLKAATVVLALDEGLALHREVDSDAVPEGLFYEFLADMVDADLARARSTG
jgi:AcrR family transcriptional regulator